MIMIQNMDVQFIMIIIENASIEKQGCASGIPASLKILSLFGT